MKTSKLKPIPKFVNHIKEIEFWNTHDSTSYLDWSQAKRGPIFSNLKLTSKSISIRLPDYMLNKLKNKAAKIDIPYQSLIKQILANNLD